jgi:hypothetical protein
MVRTPQLNGSGSKCFVTVGDAQAFAATGERQTVDNPESGEIAR